ncbi:tetratricopeptide repeat protein [Luteimonas sp. SJ-92]|uniref:Tetratricopeptide repeat protein n=1 Tax=Luteimonas salinisoli TaxID=2752307 RepID=A0A853JII4_9GAMM|nr:tetratricopeptide repeat protein [Luteimonas salinisoli]NZA28347.1 tetratricopeptide repeat protein [Luteimonas salinisoli]
MQNFRTWAPWLGLVASVALAGLAYRPGLSGTFHFDDFANLPTLGAMGRIDNWPTFWRYVTSGHADPTGRPISVLSFLLDARDWPAEPYPFLRTNLLLHLCNGVLLALLLTRLGCLVSGSMQESKLGDGKVRARMAGVLGASFWMLHPLFVSTTLYVVQREAMLPATFVLIGLLVWLRARRLFQTERDKTGLALMALGLGGCTALATLSKANGALLPAFALVIEVVVLKRLDPIRRPAVYRRAMFAFAWIPTIAIAAYLLGAGWNGLFHGISDSRPWTLGQRLLTQPRVILEYLNLLWMPRPFGSGIFNDHVQPSNSLFSPISTALSLATLLALSAGSWTFRRRYPLAALAIFFYFVGQLIESSTIALELQFEHRNYLPSMLMFWPLAAWLCGFRLSAGDSGANTFSLMRPLLAIALVVGLASMTHMRASLWGDTRTQAILWAELNPDSARAQAYAASVEVENGRPDQARHRLRRALNNNPDDIQLALGLFSAECTIGNVASDTLTDAATAFARTREVGGLLTSWFAQAITRAEKRPCPELNLEVLEGLIEAAQANRFLQSRPARRQDLLHLHGRIALARARPNVALASFNQALEEQVRPGFALEQAALLGAAGYPALGLAHLDHYDAMEPEKFTPGFGMPRIHMWVLDMQGYWKREMIHLREVLMKDSTPVRVGAH